METTPPAPPISDEEARAALTRLLASRGLRASRRLCRFLEHTVGAVLAGRADELKESALGMAVYDRPAAYEKSEDSIVRTEARRLRQKLSDYYAAEGKDDPVRVHFSPGSYVPSFSRLQPDEIRGDTEPKLDVGERGGKPVGEGVPIAVLPLTDLSGSSFSARCARMLTEELVHRWTHVDGVSVVSIEAFPATLLSGGEGKGEQRSSVCGILSGSVWEEDGALRVTLRLMRHNGFLIWSQRFEAKADARGLHRLTDQLASALINRLRPETSSIRKEGEPISAEHLAVLPTLYEAEALLDEGTGEDLQIPAAKFQEIIRATPDAARPLCGLADCYCVATLYGVANSSSLIRHAATLAKQAVELDQGMVLAWATQGLAHLLGWKWHEAERCFQKALASGDHALAARQYALLLTASERSDEAEFFIEKAQTLDPFSGRQKVAHSLFFYFMRRNEELQSLIAEEDAFGSQPAVARLLLAFSQVHQGRHDDASRLALSCRKTIGGQPNLMALVAEVMALCGDREQARHIASVFKLLASDSPISFYRRALLSMAIGQSEDAWSSLLEAAAVREPELVWLKVEPRLDPFRGDERFELLLKAVTSSGGSDAKDASGSGEERVEAPG